MGEYQELFKNEPLAQTLWKASIYGFSMEAWMIFVVEIHKLEAMAKAGLLDGRGWFLRLHRIHTEARNINNLYSNYEVSREAMH